MSDIDEPPDLTLCDREPITRLERIQSFGFLLAMSKDWTVVRASANLGMLLGIEAVAAIGAKLVDLVDRHALHNIRNRMAFLVAAQGIERLYGMPLVPGKRFDIAVHYANSMIVLEGEPTSLDEGMEVASLVRAMVVRLGTQQTLEAFHRDAARQVRLLTGFDRVMIYRFDQGGAGEVIAESLTSGMEAYLGLHYPASDIPAQARALYLRNPFRIIADVDAPTVVLLPVEAGVEPLDQSLAFTRAVSPVHIEYLRNMGVAASLSISIIVDGALWGLVACHHRTPRLKSFVIRTATELFGQMYSMKLERRLRRFDTAVERKAQELVDRIGESIAPDEMLLSDADWWRAAIGDLIECDGVAVAFRGLLSMSGDTPPRSDIEALVQRLNSMSSQRVFTADHLAALYPEAALHVDRAAGVLSIPISHSPQDYILLFRRERLQAITWAGNPEKPTSKTDDGLRLSPRKSFEAFRTISRGRALPFTEQNRRTASALRSALIDVILGFSRHGDEEFIKTAQRQELLIAELNHRARNIFGLIRGLINQGGTENASVAAYVQSLNGRIQSLARAHDQITRVNWGPGRLCVLFDQELRAYIPQQQERFILRGPEALLHPQAFSTLSLVVHELVTNSVKYGSLSGQGSVVVTLELKAGDGLYIQWRETGGPAVQTPRRRGFGSVIVERVIPFDLKGTAQIRYEPGGVEADFFVPEEHIAAESATPPELDRGSSSVRTVVSADPEQQRPLEGRAVLLVEDNLILALDAEDLLHRLGANAVFLASTIHDAALILRNERIDFALLDVHVGKDTSLEFALSVRDSKIAYVFATGHGENVSLGPQHASACVVSKPYGRLEMISVIDKALGGISFPTPGLST
ncbi:MAG TPA: HWE histidine kinase domain-containing protein [Steroidobacteraceae bacterium]|nr:HWE histidine kinase domain-containing protein [Steroidobacteraceae bacterium]